jgi:hypothetical protein
MPMGFGRLMHLPSYLPARALSPGRRSYAQRPATTYINTVAN